MTHRLIRHCDYFRLINDNTIYVNFFAINCVIDVINMPISDSGLVRDDILSNEYKIFYKFKTKVSYLYNVLRIFNFDSKHLIFTGEHIMSNLFSID